MLVPQRKRAEILVPQQFGVPKTMRLFGSPQNARVQQFLLLFLGHIPSLAFSEVAASYTWCPSSSACAVAVMRPTGRNLEQDQRSAVRASVPNSNQGSKAKQDYHSLQFSAGILRWDTNLVDYLLPGLAVNRLVRSLRGIFELMYHLLGKMALLLLICTARLPRFCTASVRQLPPPSTTRLKGIRSCQTSQHRTISGQPFYRRRKQAHQPAALHRSCHGPPSRVGSPQA